MVIVHALDRFYRNLPRLLSLEQLQQQHVAFVSVTGVWQIFRDKLVSEDRVVQLQVRFQEFAKLQSVSEQLDFTSSWGKLELAVLGSLAEIYVEKLRAETTKGKQARARKGLWNGSTPFGYCTGLCAACTDVNGRNYCPSFGQSNRGDGHRLIAHPIESVEVQLAYAWYQTGQYSDGAIAEKLNSYTLTVADGTTRHFRSKRCGARGEPQPFLRDSVRELLMRVLYTGQVPYYGTTAQGQKLKRQRISFLTPGQHPALISPDLYERCQQVRALLHGAPRTRQGRTAGVFPLTGLLYCADCGGRMIGRQRQQIRRYYCTARIQHRGRCLQPSARADLIEPRIITRLSSLGWPADWREQWREALEGAEDEESLKCQDVSHGRTGHSHVRPAERGSQAEEEEQQVRAATERAREIERLIHHIEPLSEFAERWAGATAVGILTEQKRLLRLAFLQVRVREGRIETLEVAPVFAHLLEHVNLVACSEWSNLGNGSFEDAHPRR